jgi:hypothetical protein
MQAVRSFSRSALASRRAMSIGGNPRSAATSIALNCTGGCGCARIRACIFGQNLSSIHCAACAIRSSADTRAASPATRALTASASYSSSRASTKL